ncbi:YkgJ family cysteine cluster protein [Rudaea cellulosilytica]|uniref:YkgJ family cysteine cluster protein n=1 Tax=Rudaea cellulosilytica TaxID=540746 RepID=UPI0003660A34|nr:YkgJ family cysteine cluster protein [Rudaea cellulosilytica]
MTTPIDADPIAARAIAQRNFDRLLNELSPDIVAREDGLAEEIAGLSGSAASRLRALYAALAQISDAVAPFVACHAGCTSCCHYNVSVFPLEAQFIEAWTGHRRLARTKPAGDFRGQACPFLKQGRCSIYAHRPVACRQHFALTATAHWCAPERCSQETFPLVQFSSAADAFVDIIQQDGRNTPLDMRQWFGSEPID